jgi:hypothetical protein
MIMNHGKPRGSFYLIWIILTTLCIPIAFFLSLIALKIITQFVGDFINVNGVRHITEDYLFPYIFVPTIGLLTGLLQYGLLRQYLPRIHGWVLATTASWLLGVFLIVLAGWLKLTDGAFTLVAFPLMGLAIGIGQWLVLRQRLPQAGWWIGANLMGWGLSTLITAGNAVDQFQLFALGLLPACVTAVALALLMNQVQTTQESST